MLLILNFRCEHSDQFKLQNNGVISILDKRAAKHAEFVDKTPFDYENNLALKSYEFSDMSFRSYVCFPYVDCEKLSGKY